MPGFELKSDTMMEAPCRMLFAHLHLFSSPNYSEAPRKLYYKQENVYTSLRDEAMPQFQYEHGSGAL